MPQTQLIHVSCRISTPRQKIANCQTAKHGRLRTPLWRSLDHKQILKTLLHRPNGSQQRPTVSVGYTLTNGSRRNRHSFLGQSGRPTTRLPTSSTEIIASQDWTCQLAVTSRLSF